MTSISRTEEVERPRLLERSRAMVMPAAGGPGRAFIEHVQGVHALYPSDGKPARRAHRRRTLPRQHARASFLMGSTLRGDGGIMPSI